MKLSFKEISNGLVNEVYVDNNFIGTVTKNVWNNKWVIEPDFSFYGLKDKIKNSKYDDFYKAGKALEKLYKDTFIFFDDDEDITQEFDMRGILKQRGP